MKRRIAIASLCVGAAVLSLAHASLLSTPTPFVILKSTRDFTQVSLDVPNTLQAASSQRLSSTIVYNHACALDNAGKPTITQKSVPYTRIAAKATRTGSDEVLVEWTAREFDRMNTYAVDACTVQAPLWTVKTHQRKILLSDNPVEHEGWTLRLSSSLIGSGVGEDSE